MKFQEAPIIDEVTPDSNYQVILPRFMTEAAPIQNTGFEDTVSTVAEKAQRDYDFVMQNNMTLGGLDALKREWATASGLVKKIPFAGGILSTEESLKLRGSAQRLQKPSLYENKWNDFVLSSGGATIEDISAIPFVDKQQWIEAYKKRDKDLVSAHLKYISTDKTFMNKLITGASALPTYMAEFAATGGLASLGDDIAVKGGEKILGEYAKSAAGKLALKTTGWAGGAVSRSSGLGHNVLDKMSQRQLNTVLGLQEEEGWAMSALIGWGDTVIEAASETTGEGITAGGGYLLNKLPFGSKLTSALEKTWITVTGGTKGEFARKMLSKGGYSNILGEIGEERLGTILRAITDVDDFGMGKDASMIDRLKAGILQDIENIGVEVGVLAIPAGGQFVLSKLTGIKPDFDATKFDQTPPLEPPPSAEVVAEITKPTETAQAPKTGTLAAQEGQTAAEPTKVAPAPKTEPQKPITIETANTSKEVNSIVEQIVTQGVDLTKTSARQADLNGFRAALHLDGIASKERQSWQKALQQAKDQNIITDAMNIAAQVNAGVKTITVAEKAGLVMKVAQLKYQHAQLEQQLSKTEDAGTINDIKVKEKIIEDQFDTLTNALFSEGSKAGRLLNAQKLTINQNFDLISLKNRAKKMKGRELTAKENEKIERMAKDLELQQTQNELLQKRINELMAKHFVREGSVRRFSRMSRAEINTELDTLVARTQQLLEEGCMN